MFHETRARAENALSKFREPSRFLRAWVDSPLTTGALAPSGPVLAQRMAEFIPIQSNNPVLELGPGTGPVTKAILDEGVSKDRLTCLEYRDDFCEHLSEKFEGLRVVQGDAYNMRPSLKHIAPNTLCAVVSSLPLVSRPMKYRMQCIKDAFALMRPGAPFIQFSYSLVSPVTLKSTMFSWSKTGWIIKNIPPARVWIYRKPF
ncbi:Ribosomal RNA small subunit methyltransferase A [Pseudovibrio axinellae]|uniref:Ribosomal RNA small subunit methyltransferase A n=1 Tax=Pseudovibrio axinellae TaxID=989403 RepID=A0A165Z7F1_9HYPH|nr:rRNA adenine N-6-methyltransferase family protein [Pseudovibrio axinellae]KZL19578.1 Ribosomal RNA small subunit methyltransferase A [Pseudovibrio axinellae]SEQ32771.1 phosphatidylethanolamine/phosphatidyl-N-methylethanolamine N-methyltransferase [Pseudovibrio axinellae]